MEEKVKEIRVAAKGGRESRRGKGDDVRWMRKWRREEERQKM